MKCWQASCVEHTISCDMSAAHCKATHIRVFYCSSPMTCRLRACPEPVLCDATSMSLQVMEQSHLVPVATSAILRSNCQCVSCKGSDSAPSGAVTSFEFCSQFWMSTMG
jgi:hypothetical protein